MVDQRNFYDILGVSEDALADELTKAYRHKALEQHPDKGGDKDDFDALAKAFKTLDCKGTRDAYDAELARARERAKLVEGGPSKATPGVFSQQQVQAPMPRQKTEPHAGSTRQGKIRNIQPGKPDHCANEWKGMRSGAAVLKMLEDDITEVQKTQVLFDKYAALPRGADKKRDWLNGVRGKEKHELKQLAKKKEAEQRAKCQKWLSHGPSVTSTWVDGAKK